jgi:hypothetical protein
MFVTGFRFQKHRPGLGVLLLVLHESDARPMHLCPVCLRKLHHSIGFDVVGRYGELYHFYDKTGFEEEAKWTAQRLERIAGRAAAEAIIEQQKKRAGLWVCEERHA